MNYEESSAKIRQQLADYSNTNADDWFLCLKARFGMAVVFNALRDIKGYGDVITTPYTCITSINPILVSGLKPVYADIDQNFLSTLSIKETLTKAKTHAVVMQHTLGMVGDKSKLASFAKKHNLILIEDSAHCVTRLARDKKGKVLADISVHSFGVEKILTGSKFGGAIYVNPELRKKNKELYDKITEKLRELRGPDRAMAFRMRTYRTNNAVLQRLPSRLKSGLRNIEIKTGILEPAVYPFEQEAHQDEPRTTNLFVNKIIIEQLDKLKSNFGRRQSNVELYKKHLKSTHFKNITKLEEPLLAYPILFENQDKAQEAYDMLTAGGYFIRRWYSPLLYPGPKSMKRYYYNPKDCPIAEDVSRRVLCLPTDLPAIQTQNIINMLKDHKIEQ